MAETEQATTKSHSKARAHISPHHADDLREYFRDAVAYFSAPSTMGAQLERAMFFSHVMKPCVKCGGDVKKWKPGTGFVSSAKDYQQHQLLVRLGVLQKGEALPGDTPCPKCSKPDRRGDDPGQFGELGADILKARPWAPGWVPGSKRHKAPTAQITGSSKHGTGVPDTGGTDAMERYGRTDRLLAKVRRTEPGAYVVAERWFSPGGETLVALWDLTPAGKTMLRGNAHDLPAPIYFDILRDRQSKQRDFTREMQFKAADDQAQKLYDAMAEVVVLVAGAISR